MMIESKRSGNTLRSIAALVAGFIVTVVLSLIADVALHAANGDSITKPAAMSDTMFAIATLYRTAFAVVGCYVMARLAPNRPMMHALFGGAIGLVLSIVGAVATWNRGPEFGPKWYPIAIVLTAIPCAWLGGKLRRMQLGERT